MDILFISYSDAEHKTRTVNTNVQTITYGYQSGVKRRVSCVQLGTDSDSERIFHHECDMSHMHFFPTHEFDSLTKVFR